MSLGPGHGIAGGQASQAAASMKGPFRVSQLESRGFYKQTNLNHSRVWGTSGLTLYEDTLRISKSRTAHLRPSHEEPLANRHNSQRQRRTRTQMEPHFEESLRTGYASWQTWREVVSRQLARANGIGKNRHFRCIRLRQTTYNIPFFALLWSCTCQLPQD